MLICPRRKVGIKDVPCVEGQCGTFIPGKGCAEKVKTETLIFISKQLEKLLSPEDIVKKKL